MHFLQHFSIKAFKTLASKVEIREVRLEIKEKKKYQRNNKVSDEKRGMEIALIFIIIIIIITIIFIVFILFLKHKTQGFRPIKRLQDTNGDQQTGGKQTKKRGKM